MTLTLRFRVIHERNSLLHMGVPFFAPCPSTGGLPVHYVEACPGATWLEHLREAVVKRLCNS
jgi:hypothetical protein